MLGKRTAKRPKVKRRTKFTIFAMVNLFWYTVVVLIANFHDHTVAPELTVAWFAAWTAELAMLAGIKITDRSSNDAEG